MIPRSQNQIWAVGFSLVFPAVYVPLWIIGSSTDLQLHVYLWVGLFALGAFFYGLSHPKTQTLRESMFWLSAFACIAFVAGLFFDFIRYPRDMSDYLGETFGVFLCFFCIPSLLSGFGAFFSALFIKRIFPESHS